MKKLKIIFSPQFQRTFLFARLPVTSALANIAVGSLFSRRTYFQHFYFKSASGSGNIANALTLHVSLVDNSQSFLNNIMLDTITKQNQVILELLASLKAEQTDLTVMVMRHLIENHNCDYQTLNDNYIKDAKDELENLKIQIKSKFGLDESIDDLLNSALK